MSVTGLLPRRGQHDRSSLVEARIIALKLQGLVIASQVADELGSEVAPMPARSTRRGVGDARAGFLTSVLTFYNICPIKMPQRSRQQALLFRSWGGRRSGAGRKPARSKPNVPHRQRPIHEQCHPAHVTMRVMRGVPSLRSAHVFPAVRRGIAIGSTTGIRIVHFSVQTNHVHLLVEADGTRALGRGMQGLGIRLAKAINRVLARTGRVWSDRYHCRALRTPRETRNTLVYVLLNGRKHHVTGRGIDRCSSGTWFAGWRQRIETPAGPFPVAEPRTWLLRIGWRRGGSIGLEDAPVRAG